MGVRGLTTYINYNRDAILEQFYLHNTQLVIDGHSLCAQLYSSLNCFSAFGGDYDKYAMHVKNFFKNLRKCNVLPYVLFDGSYETRKLRTAYSRLSSKIYGASRLDPVTQGSLQIFPLLLRDVFIEVLAEIDVPYTVCEFEADDEIAALARHLNCPVLSYDSDFFIYNVLYIPFNTLEAKPQTLVENDNKVYALECKIFKIENLTDHFGGLNKEMMPLLATLLGNDFVEKRVFNKFFSQLKLPKSKKNQNEQQRCIHGLLKWLQTETLDSAIAKILGRLKKNKKHKVFAIIKKSVAAYNTTECESLKYFDVKIEERVNQPELEILEAFDGEESSSDSSNKEDNVSEDNSDVEAEDNERLGMPNWFADYIRQKRIPQCYINLYTHHLYFCSPQAEDYSDDDACLCALPLVRFAFDILTDFAHESFTIVCRQKNSNDKNYTRLQVGTEYSIPRPLEKSFTELCYDELFLYFNEFVKLKMQSLDFSEIELLPPNFKIFMISLLWWVKNCSVPLNHIHSLFICYIMLEVIDEKTGTFRGHYNFNNKYSKKLEELRKRPNTKLDNKEMELSLNKNKVQYEDCLVAASVLLKHFEIDDSIRKKPKTYDVKRMHSFAQFQYCLMHFNSLNKLCAEPFTCTRYSKSYNGTFVYNIALKLENQSDPENFVHQYLNGANTVLMFYRSLCFIYNRCAQKMDLITTKTIGKKHKRRKQNVKNEINFIVRGFESEVVI
ncbi:protein asteroid [Hyposmocoma kahamanoa]|uniref:protein asteroid n=1 Tax=Hyposmocoma kahamanoa TaxID=1477025 RepID=UPI000E6D65BD|nr:protein asteroid [Hyposmocoma kahamanoa]